MIYRTTYGRPQLSHIKGFQNVVLKFYMQIDKTAKHESYHPIARIDVI